MRTVRRPPILRRIPALAAIAVVVAGSLMPLHDAHGSTAGGSSRAPAALGTGSASAAAKTHVYYYIETPGNRGVATGVSDGQLVVGYYLFQGREVPFVHPFNNGSGTTTALPLEPGFLDGAALAISPDGKTVVGFEVTPGTNPCWAVRWKLNSATGQYVVTRLAAGTNSTSGSNIVIDCSVSPLSVLDSGVIYMHTNDPTKVLRWENGQVTELTQASGVAPIPGRTQTANGFRIWNDANRAWAQSGPSPAYELLRLSQTVSNPEAFAAAVSEHREVVGYSRLTVTQADGTNADIYHAVRWQDDGAPVDLNRVTKDLASGTGFDITLWKATNLNRDGDVVGSAIDPAHGGGFETPMILIALPPIVFVPGVSGSILNYADGSEAWLNIDGLHYNLALTSDELTAAEPGGIYAERIVAHETLAGFHLAKLQIYGPFLDALAANGFSRYSETTRANRTSAGCDLDQRPDNPNLFIFPYDWRLPNERSAQGLADFMGCVRKFYTGPVILAAHSMGGLVSRRYLLDRVAASPADPTDSYVRDLVTIGTPWLGAPKFINVIETGDFLDFLLPSTTKTIVPTMYGPRQLLPSAAYYSLVNDGQVPLRESSWDLNGSGADDDFYGYGMVNRLLDAQFPANGDVTEIADRFHANPGQDDWTHDPVGVRSTVIYAVQAVDRSIGQVIAVTRDSCTINFLSFNCRPTNVFNLRYVPGDGTVPEVSAARKGNGRDLNDPRRETLIRITSGTDDQLEHVALPGHPDVIEALMRVANRRLPGMTLTSVSLQGSATSGSLLASPNASSGSSVAGQAPAAPVAPGAWYVALSGLTGTTAVMAPDGTSDAVDPLHANFRPALPGVVHQPTGDDSEVAVVPFSSGAGYTETFTAGPAPMHLEVRRGSDASPDLRATWLDLNIPAGSVATLSLAGDGSVALSYRETAGASPVAVPPTALVTGALAKTTLTAPEVSVTSTIIGGARRYILAAGSGGGAPITQILWSVDGTTFRRYTSPIAIDPETTTLRAFADDAAGNRSPLQVLDLRGAPTGPYTTMGLSPDLPASGWSQVPVSVVLRTHPSDATTTQLHHRVEPPSGPAVDTTVDDTTAIIEVSAEGRTTIRFHSTDDAGGVEPGQLIQIGIDGTAPSVAITSPASDSSSGAFPAISGTAVDGASGVSAVAITIQRIADGQFWSGTAWQPSEIELAATLSTGWSFSGTLPSGSNAPAGGYAVTARATDAAGNIGVARNGFLISSTPTIRELRSPNDGLALPTLGLGINNSGVASGKWGGLFTCQFCYSAAVRWDTSGAPTIIRDGTTSGALGFQANAVNDAGQVVGFNPSTAVLWEADGTQRTLVNGNEAHDVNNQSPSVAVGIGGVNWGTWTGAGAFTLLPAPSGYASEMWWQSDHQTAINDSGTVVGTRFVTVPGYTQRFWAAAMATPAGASFIFDPGDRVESHAFDINNAGVIVGDRSILVGHFGLEPYVPFVRAADGTITMFSLSGAGLGTGSARGINNAGVIVGDGFPGWPDGVYVDVQPVNQRAWIYRDGAARDLNTFLPPGSGWILTSASKINDRGEIVGTGLLNGRARGYVLSPGGGALEIPIIALDQAVETTENTAVDVQLALTSPISPAPTWSVESAPVHGSAAISGSTARYTPEPGFQGEDAFQVRATGGSASSNTATIHVTVRAALAAPVAVIDAPGATTAGASILVDGSGSFDPNGFGPLSFAWDLDDDGLDDAFTAQATTSFAGAGPHHVRLTITGSGGTATADASIEVVEAPFEPSPERPRTLAITKVVTGTGAAGYVGAYRLDVDCDGAAHEVSLAIIAGETVRLSGLPGGATCSVSEPTLPTVPGYTFGSTAYEPSSATVTIPDAPGSEARITVENELTRDLGSIRISTSVIGASASYSGTFTYRVSCDLDGGESVVSVTSPTPGSTTVTGIPTGSACQVTPDGVSTPPAGHAWDSVEVLGSPAVSVSGGGSDVVVRHVVDSRAGVVKTVAGGALSGTQAFTFELRFGAIGPDIGGTLLETKVVNLASAGSASFSSSLSAGGHYQVCELMDVGWRSSLGPAPFQLTLAGVNDRVCVDFEALAGATVTFSVDNTPPPGGGAMALGYWKNHASCSSSRGNQAPILDQTLARFPVAKGEKKPGFYVGKLYVDSCAKAYALLSKLTLDGKSASSHAAWAFASQYVAYMLNIKAGAASVATATVAAANGQALIVSVKFNGYLPLDLTKTVEASLRTQADLLDLYNNNRLP